MKVNTGKWSDMFRGALAGVILSLGLSGCGAVQNNAAESRTPSGSATGTVAVEDGKGGAVTNLIEPATHPAEDDRVKALESFMKKDIKSRPETRKWEGDSGDWYFSVQYTADSTPCLFVTDHVFHGYSNEACVYDYDTEKKEVRLLTYMATSGSGDPLETIKGKFISTTHHSYRVYHWGSASDSVLRAEEIYGYYVSDESELQSDKFTRTAYEWNVPLRGELAGSPGKVDQCASNMESGEDYPVRDAIGFAKEYASAAPVQFYKNIPVQWSRFYRDGHMESCGYSSSQGDFRNGVQKNISRMTDYDYIRAERESSVVVNGARLDYLGQISEDLSLFYVSAGGDKRAFVLRTGLEYEIFLLDVSGKAGTSQAPDAPDADGEDKVLYCIDYQYLYYKSGDTAVSTNNSFAAYRKGEDGYMEEEECKNRDGE